MITEIQVKPIKPKNGLIAFASVVLDNSIYLGSIGLMTRLNGGYRLTYPTKQVGSVMLDIFYPINKQFAENLENIVIEQYKKITQKDDRHN